MIVPKLSKVSGEAFAGTTVELDGKWFDACTFDNCLLRFEGREAFGYSNGNRFTGCQLQLYGVAELVVGTLGEWFGADTVARIVAAQRLAIPIKVN